MAQSTEKYRRLPVHFHSPGYAGLTEMVGVERWHFLSAQIFTTLFQEPSVAALRGFLGGMLWELHNNPSEAREAGYDNTDILVSILLVQELATSFGLLLGHEIWDIQQGQQLKMVDPTTKYRTWEQMQQLDPHKYRGILHGAIDPPHLGHPRAAARVWPVTDEIVVGFDPNWWLRQRKGEDRPRFSLAWRMWEMASLPSVDWVFVLPVHEGTDEEFMSMYRQLSIKALSTSDDNPYLPEYQRRMAELGGQVVSDMPVRWSSSKLMETYARRDPSGQELARDKRWAEERSVIARAFGYLVDYPDGTDNKSR